MLTELLTVTYPAYSAAGAAPLHGASGFAARLRAAAASSSLSGSRSAAAAAAAAAAARREECGGERSAYRLLGS